MSAEARGIFVTESYDLFRLGLEPDTQICLNCKHFHQHYNRAGNFFLALQSGHCSYPRMKNRRVTDTCEHFENKSALPDAANI